MFSKVLVLALAAFCVYAADGAAWDQEGVKEIAQAVEIPEIYSEESKFWGRPHCRDVGQWTLILPNYWNCETFWLCANGIPYLMECPAGLQYNGWTRKCDYPENVKCWHN